MDLKEVDILGGNIGKHWYYQSKAKALSNLISGLNSKKILDIGSGSAFFSRYILDHSDANEAWCIDISYLSESDESRAGKTLHYRKSIHEANEIELVLLMDVLEHIEDDLTFLSHYVSMVPAGTAFLISVPAFQWLWSSHDEYLEHQRRYTLSEVEKLAKMAGLEINLGCYFFGLVLPIAAVVRLFERCLKPSSGQLKSSMKSHSPLVNFSLKMICSLECTLLRHNRLAGLSVFCLARKP
ncbi:class I SAM-dependent methyltransferase [Polynucleobacter arcticus]|uniref:Methyltransferase n=1 Tax=Polynucleobacter arcticus TaxID=1743165 RepID=A0A6M9PI41_9BURK|nr:methyltransferase domain-containing protein [Polynucleobacter arcticus]QKM60081.1 methyltransferase [Polynucleobacter arcticus]